MVAMPAYPHIEQYYFKLKELVEFGGSDSELNIRPAFQNCLDAYCRDHREKLVLVPELRSGAVIPDGTVKDTLRMARGYWEAKDTHDDLDAEIQTKFNRGYPQDNIVFEDSATAVLIQNGGVALRVDMSRPGELHRLIRRFLDYELPNIEEFRLAQRQFKTDLPAVLDNLRQAVAAAEESNPDYQAAAQTFLDLCRQTISPEVSGADVREMLLQHILTKDVFLRVFAEDQFHRENNVARQLDQLEQTFFTGDVRRQAIDRLRAYYGAIGRAADEIADYAEKQQFIKAIYEDFYKAYNPAAADRLGVVYTPNEVVDFIIRGADYLLQKHFGRTLADDNVQILDPATGTGTFITNLINYLPADRLQHKYDHEIHANEVAILPYYIANLNIEYTYRERTGHYREFPGLCFVDTLDNMAWKGATGGAVERQGTFELGAMSEENWLRVQEQNEKDISVIIGNPPYNAHQGSFNEFNPNRSYPMIDQRIRETYSQAGTAQNRNQQYDIYKRFIRWASDRLADDGIIGFITNRSYLDTRQDDGFRKLTSEEFTDVYILDLGADVRRNPKISGTTHNVFGIQTGVAIAFLVRDKSKLGQCGIHYARREDAELARDKLAFLNDAKLIDIAFESIAPDAKHNWLNQSNSNFERLLPLTDRQTMGAVASDDEKAVFKLYSNGLSTQRDEWVFDFDESNLVSKIRFFAGTYENKRIALSSREFDDSELGTEIKWDYDLRMYLKRNITVTYSQENIVESLYRPFTKKKLYFSRELNSRQYQLPRIFLSGKSGQNKVICFKGPTAEYFSVLASDNIPECKVAGTNNGRTFCLPLYRYTPDGERISNTTEWGLRQFRERYGDDGISAEDIFAYTYAVLHDPAYREKYAIDLLREFPRLPFYDNFPAWVDMGQQLLNLHIGFESVEPFGLAREDLDGDAKRVILRADKGKGAIVLDDKTTLTGVPPEAWEYRLGSRSALEWVLDQYKERKPRDPTIAAQFNTYRFADYKERVIDLLRRVCTVSVKTVEIVGRMAYWEGDELRAFGDRERDDFTTAALVQWAKEPEDAEWLEELREIWLETSSGSDCP